MVLLVYWVIFLKNYILSLYLIVMLVEEKFNSKLFWFNLIDLDLIFSVVRLIAY